MFLNPHQKSVIYVILSGALFGSIGFFGIQAFNSGISVPEFLFGRFILASLIFLIICWRSIRKYNLKNLFTPFILGLAIYSPSTYLWFESIKLIGSGLSMVIFYSFPVYVAILSWMIKKDNIGKVSIFSIIVMMIGLLLIADLRESCLDYKGLFFSLLSAILYGVYFFISKKSCREIDSNCSAFMVCVGNTFGFAAILIFNNNFTYNYSKDIYLLLLLIAIFGTALPILFLFKGLKNTSELEASILSVSEPIVSLLIGIILLDEHFCFNQIIGIILITASAILVQLRKTKPNLLA